MPSLALSAWHPLIPRNYRIAESLNCWGAHLAESSNCEARPHDSARFDQPWLCQGQSNRTGQAITWPGPVDWHVAGLLQLAPGGAAKASQGDNVVDDSPVTGAVYEAISDNWRPSYNPQSFWECKKLDSSSKSISIIYLFTLSLLLRPAVQSKDHLREHNCRQTARSFDPFTLLSMSKLNEGQMGVQCFLQQVERLLLANPLCQHGMRGCDMGEEEDIFFSPKSSLSWVSSPNDSTHSRRGAIIVATGAMVRGCRTQSRKNLNNFLW